jgi:hypothetical protein
MLIQDKHLPNFINKKGISDAEFKINRIGHLSVINLTQGEVQITSDQLDLASAH